MTNAEAKQEAIKKAYGDKWDRLKEFCDSDGWITNKWIAHGVPVGIDYEDAGFTSDDVIFQQYNSSNSTWRLRSIYPILTNNGWIRIEPDGSNLPTDNGLFNVMQHGKGTSLYRNATYNSIDGLLNCPEGFLNQNCEKLINVTHYKPITPELKPIY